MDQLPKIYSSMWKSSLTFLILLVPVFFICLAFGLITLNPFEIFNPEYEHHNLLTLRAWRLLCAFTTGGALAISGASYQAVLRNPLAQPFILGISGGASLGAALSIAFKLHSISFIMTPLCAFIGAVTILCLVLFIARGAGTEYTNNILLSGVIMSTVCSSLLMFLISELDAEELHNVTWWMLGNLRPGNMKLLYFVTGTLIAGSLILFSCARQANVISLGEEMTYYLGFSPRLVILIILLTGSFLTASAVSLSGIIGFVGLLVPHVLRRIFGADHRQLFPISVLGGGMFLMICDSFGRTVIAPIEIPVGVITSFIGGPFFLWILNKRRKEKVL